MADKFQDECGVFGIAGSADAVRHTIRGLYALQHRGQESWGVAVSDGHRMTTVRRMGCVSEMDDEDVRAMTGTVAIGHVRYSTVGASTLANAQPITSERGRVPMALCHNGQIGNVRGLSSDLGCEPATSSDSAIVLQLLARSTQGTASDALAEILPRLEGAFSLAVLASGELIAARDPHGFRPLCLGRLGGALIVCSETCALDAIGAEHIGEVTPGHVVVLDPARIRTIAASPEVPRAHCVFEHVYFARPDSRVFGVNVGAVRLRAGRILAREAPVDADVIVPLPDSGMWASFGYHEQSAITIAMGLVRNAYVGRTFIQPSHERRDGSIHLKLNPVADLLAGRRVVLIDDSIVRGSTMRHAVAAVRSSGATEVHVRIASPPVIAPCFFGIDTPARSQLLAGRLSSLNDVRHVLGADSLAYLSLGGLMEAVGNTHPNYCSACYTGRYPETRQRADAAAPGATGDREGALEHS